MWGNGLAISNNAGIPAYVKMEMVSDENNGAFIAWHRDNGFVFDAYVQHIAHDGALSFPANGLVLSNNSSIHQLDPVLAYDAPTGDLYAFWREHNANQTMRGISGQRISSDGNRLWGVQGKIILPMQSGEKAGLSAALTGAQPVICFYESPQGSMNSFVKAIRLDENGNTVWPQEQVALSLVESDKMHFDASPFVNNQLIITWADKRNDGGDIYAQNLLEDGSLGPQIPYLITTPDILSFTEANQIMDGLDFYVNNIFPVSQAIDSMTLFGDVNNLGDYIWFVEPDLNGQFPYPINPDESLVFSVYWGILVANRSMLYDTIRIWSGGDEYTVVIELDTAVFPLRINELNKSLQLQAWPNPFSAELNMVFNSLPYEDSGIEIFNTSGILMWSEMIKGSGSELQRFSWDGYNAAGNRVNPGMYYLRFTNAAKTAVLPVMYMPR